MNKLESITKGVSKMVGKSRFLFQKHSPEILLVVGITGMIGSTILACRATLKVEGILMEHNNKKEKINLVWEDVKKGDISLDEYSERDHQKDLLLTYAQTTRDFVKLYGPVIVLGGFSISCIIGGHGILKRRNVALIAAYKAIEEGFNAYRKRVIEEFGEEKDYMLRHGLRSEIVTETEIDADGKTRKVKKTKLVGDPNGLSVYSRFYDDGCSQWSNNAEYNLMFLKAQQNYHNDILKTRGHVFLNEVYDALGIPRTQAGSVVGWMISDNGDNYIDFGVFDGDKPRSRDFVNGYEKSILLDFNVDGVIYDLFTKSKA